MKAGEARRLKAVEGEGERPMLADAERFTDVEEREKMLSLLHGRGLDTGDGEGCGKPMPTCSSPLRPSSARSCWNGCVRSARSVVPNPR